MSKISRYIIKLTSLILALSIVYNANAEDVWPGSTGNTLKLHIHNESSTFSLPGVSVTVLSKPSWVSFTSSTTVNVGDIAASATKTANFTFSVDENAQLCWTGTVNLKVTATSGDEWTSESSLHISLHVLPVELSSFTAERVNGIAVLHWATQSETNNLGWNVYHGKNDDNFVNAAKINNEMIAGYGSTSEPHDYIYEDEIEDAIPRDIYWYWLVSIDLGGEVHHYNMVAKLVIPEDYEPQVPPELPIIYGLYQNAPNPYNPTLGSATRICFNLHNSSFVEINIYNIRGEFVKCIYNDLAEFDKSKPKPKVAYWYGKDEAGVFLGTGIYLYQLKVNGKVYESKKLILMR